MIARLKRLARLHGPRLLAVAQRAFLVVALVSIATYLGTHAELVSTLLTRQVLFHCVLSAVILGALHPLIGSAFFLLQRQLQIGIDLRTSLSVYMRRIPARYIPGGIWHSAARYADLNGDSGVRGSVIRRLFLTEMSLVATSGMLVCGSGLLVLPPGSRSFWSAAALACVALLIMLVTGLKVSSASMRYLGAAAILFVLAWMGGAAAFVLIASADGLMGGPASTCAPAALGASYLISSVLGYLAIFAPQGWGVSEASFTVTNPCQIPLHTVLGAFVLFRISAMLGDLLAYAAWAALFRKNAPASAPSR